ncbi:MAG: 50S ribosomal protein L9 [Eubacteriales bacterium]|jgi:large subunit ribosomal protein L9|nr:50S ribosomal protein L9 [Eubacteriales bacterium]MDD4105274.1 50S ribosomal protein L9 [Eubacteriales bacterium]MDD4710531.1 50S ribosomal protein L9 [Eubacteriales bacterium]NLO14816.1 50S ribosomal protein L9 [Clostridiales bacterium]
MKVILLNDVPGTGKKNQIINVSDGYARNYLLPRKWAMEATAGAVKEVERRNEAERQKEEEQRREAQVIADSLKGKTITVSAKAGDKGRLYGSVTVQEIAGALEKQHGIAVDKRKIELKEPIRSLGETQVSVWLFSGLKIEMTVDIVPLEQ